MKETLISWVEKGLVPDPLVRLGVRRLIAGRAAECRPGEPEGRREEEEAVVASMRSCPSVALQPEKANEQHYEVPPDFFLAVLGKHLKYSCCYFPQGNESLDQAEAEMLELTCQRADLADGQEILELGCGWGSLSLWMAANYPDSRITAVSNSAPQRRFIEARAAERGLDNLRVITADMNEFSPPEDRGPFHRVVSLEMFEHMRNWQLLLQRVASWMHPGGKAFLHVFCHRDMPYFFETEGASNWMGRYFFTAGLMPSDQLAYHFQNDLRLDRHWRVSGVHYQRTSRAWLDRLDAARRQVMPVLEETYGKAEGRLWFQRWRLFFIACEELFGFRGGDEWWVGHYRFQRPEA
ncbi:MAG: cyclopropane-fatty-acyl-phospholipid synthase family protein [Acidobacteriota bacterium]